MARPIASESMRILFIEAMCGEAASDLLCWSMEKGFGQGGRTRRAAACVVLGAAALTTTSLTLAGFMEQLAWPYAQAAVQALFVSYAEEELLEGAADASAVGAAHGFVLLQAARVGQSNWSGAEWCASGACQVLKLDPGLEARLLTLLRGRILPVAQKSLRLWRKGDIR